MTQGQIFTSKGKNVQEQVYAPMVGTIVKTKQMTEMEKYFEIELPGGNPLGHMPGQFAMFSMLGVGEAPISISSSPTSAKNTFEIVVRKAGMFTGAMHKLNEGSKIGVRGPMGVPFPVDELKGNDILFVAGGLGIVPLRSLVNFVMDRRRDFGKVKILLGCKTPKEQLFTEEYERWSRVTDVSFACTVDRADPDWKGNVGVITTLIPGVDIDINRTYAVVVGPPIMYRFVIKELKSKNLSDRQIVLSLERRMKCGIGKCGHCQINNYYCCKDGPTFTYQQIRGTKEAL
jgi:sulfhydrogenase subunit gamma (sulfur reductase)